MNSDSSPLTLRVLLKKLVPLSLSDAAMALGDPLLAFTLTRMPACQIQLAALGVVKSVAVFLESPIIMMLHASTALSASPRSRQALWRFMLWLAVALTALFLFLNLPPIYHLLMGRLFAVDATLAEAARLPFLAMVLWPAVIAWRRYFQGHLIRQGRGRQMGWASLARVTVFALALAIGRQMGAQGALVGGMALMAGLVIEAGLVTHWARCVPLPEAEIPARLPETQGEVVRFYAPLAGTMILVWGGRAALVAFIARAPDAALALAAWPASWGFVILVANVTRMVQQLVIAHAREAPVRVLFELAAAAGLGASGLLLWLGLSPSGARVLSGLLGDEARIVEAAVGVVRVSVALPLLVALQNALQGFCIVSGRSTLVNVGSLVGAVGTLLAAAAGLGLGAPGAEAAASAVCLGTLGEVVALACARPWRLLGGTAG